MICKKTYLKYKKLNDQYNQLVNDYCKANKTNGIPLEARKHWPNVTNEMRSSIELYEFCIEKPKQYFLYIDDKKGIAITWTGEKLGNVWFENQYRSNMGDKRVSIEINAINGLKYYGVYFKSSGNYVRIKAYKKQ